MRNMRKLIVLALAVLVATGVGSREAHAQRVQANVTEVCAQLPAMAAALKYTTDRFPVPDNVQRVGLDLATRFTYFALIVGAGDGAFCRSFSRADVPEIVQRTALWNYGNLSVALVDYQRAVGMVP